MRPKVPKGANLAPKICLWNIVLVPLIIFAWLDLSEKVAPGNAPALRQHPVRLVTDQEQFRGKNISSLVELHRRFLRNPEPGGRRIFLDWGARNGDSFSQLDEWERTVSKSLGLPEAPIFETVYCFEARDEYNAAWANIVIAQKALGRDVHFNNVAVWTENTELSMRLADLASTVLAASNWTETTGSNYASVKAIDISEWLLANITPEDHVVVKVDIELSEIPVFQHLLRTGAAALLDVILYECHFYTMTGLNPAITEASCERECQVLTTNLGKLPDPPAFFFWARFGPGGSLEEGFSWHEQYNTTANECCLVYDPSEGKCKTE